MLNHGLVQEFRRISAQGLSGTLTVSYGAEQVRYFFRDGGLLLLDYGQDKELLLLAQHRAYHKIGPEIESLLTQLRQTQGLRIHDYLRQQQLVGDEEIEQVTRTLVEDKLCDWFGSPSTGLGFDHAADEATYDLGRSAVKLRIDVEVLLQMVEVRIAERDSVRQDIRDWSTVYGLREGAPDPGILNDMERNVLGFVDGRRSVEDIATAIRDSSLNTACYLISLSNQGFITILRSSAPRSGSLTQPVAGQTPSMPPNAAAEVRRPTIPDFQPVYRRAEPPARGSGVRVVLVAVLLVMAGLAWLVYQAKGRRDQVDLAIDEIQRIANAEEWKDLPALIGKARELALGDTSLNKRIDDALRRLLEAQAAKITTTSEQIARGEYDVAEATLAALPPDDLLQGPLNSADLAANWRKLELELAAARTGDQEAAQALADAVSNDLQRDRLDSALERLKAAKPTLTAAAEVVIRQWRGRRLDEAGDASQSLGNRRRLLELARRAQPVGQELDVIARLDKELLATAERLHKDLVQLQTAVEAGDYRKVQEAIPGLKLLASGTDLLPRLGITEQAADVLAKRITELLERSVALIRRGTVPAELAKASADIDAELSALPQLSNAAELIGMKQALGFVTQCLGCETAPEEIQRLREASAELPDGVRALLNERAGILESAEESAAADFNDVLAAVEQRGFEVALAQLEDFLVRPGISRTAIHVRAQQQLIAWKERRVQHEQQFDALVAAMRADDAKAVEVLAGQLNLPRLPIAILSDPPGAQVLIGDQPFATTPCVYRDLAQERVQLRFTVRLAGYLDREFAANEGLGGWKILAQLERSPLLTASVPGPATNQPTAIGGRIWVAGTSGVSVVAMDGKVQSYSLVDGGIGGGSLREPVYAPAVSFDGDVFFTTRDGVVLRHGPGGLIRQPLAARSNFPLLRYVSPLVLDRELHIAADLGGQLLASDPNAAGVIWRTPAGAPFACEPVLHKNFVLCAHVDGQLEVFQVENGISVSVHALKAPVLAAWSTGEGLAGICAGFSWTWHGEEIVTENLPNEAMFAARDVIVTGDYRLHLRHGAVGEEVWKPVGKLPRGEDRVQNLLRWGDQVAVVQGQALRVYGPRGFAIHTDRDFCPPIVADGNLVTVTTDGQVRVYTP